MPEQFVHPDLNTNALKTRIKQWEEPKLLIYGALHFTTSQRYTQLPAIT